MVDDPGRTARPPGAPEVERAGAGGGPPARLPAARPLSTRELPCLHARGGGSEVAHARVRRAGAGRCWPACGAGDSSGTAARTPGPSGASSAADPTPSAHDEPRPTRPTRWRRRAPSGRPCRAPDMLIFRQQPLSAAMVRRIRHVAGVTRVERFSLAQVSIQDHAINVAAVDPATYRNYNPDRASRSSSRSGTASPAARWRSARGSASRCRPTATSAWAPAPTRRRSTSACLRAADPAGRRDRQRELGEDPRHAPRQRAARLDRHPHTAVDPQADPADRRRQGVGDSVWTSPPGSASTPAPCRRRSWSARPPTRSGRSATRCWAAATSRRSRRWVASHISTETMPIIGPMTCNTVMFPQLRAALDEVVAEGLAGAIHPGQYGGCYVPRFIAGTTTLSNHAFGLAFDLNVAGEPARHRRADQPAGRADLRELGLHVGRHLALHRPHALRDEQTGARRLITSSGRARSRGPWCSLDLDGSFALAEVPAVAVLRAVPGERVVPGCRHRGRGRNRPVGVGADGRGAAVDGGRTVTVPDQSMRGVPGAGPPTALRWP